MLTLLSLLQARSFWPGGDLAERLGVTSRTLRRDIDRLRELGYRVESSRGPAGGYGLEAGSGLPPLVLTEDEAVAVAIGLHTAGSSGLLGGEDLGVGALAKLEQVLPSHLRRRVAALHTHMKSSGWVPLDQVDGVEPEMLGRLALVCRDGERLRFRYRSKGDDATDRHVDPHSLVNLDRRWYLVAWDLQRVDWRTFRVDRISDLRTTAVRIPPRELPAEDAAAFVRVSISSVPTKYAADVVLAMPIAEMQAAFGPWARGATAEGAHETRWPIGGDSLQDLVYSLFYLPAGVAYRIEADPEVLDFLAAAARGFTAAVSASSSADSGSPT